MFSHLACSSKLNVMPHNKKRHMNHKAVLIFITLTCLLTLNLKAQKTHKNDSLTVCKTVTDFFNWYVMAIKQKKNSEFQPTFVESKNGMATLDFTNYIKNLFQHNFSDSLIIKEKLSYRPCIDNLEKIKYSDFASKYNDLQSMEEINCDFGNYYRWTGGQEPIDGIRIKSILFTSKTSVNIVLEYFIKNSDPMRIDFWGSNKVSLMKIKNIWKIDGINY